MVSSRLVYMWTRTTHLAAARVRALARDAVQVAAGKVQVAKRTTTGKVAAARVAKVAAANMAISKVAKAVARLTKVMPKRKSIWFLPSRQQLPRY